MNQISSSDAEHGKTKKRRLHNLAAFTPIASHPSAASTHGSEGGLFFVINRLEHRMRTHGGHAGEEPRRGILSEQYIKKLAISSALLAVSGLAVAQSSVTQFGIVDATLQRGSGSTASRTQLGSDGNSTSRLGFRGVEDLGGGLSASFWLEATVSVDNGEGAATNTNNQTTGTSVAPNGTQGLTFGRRSTVSLAGGWGELRLGRDYSVLTWACALLKPVVSKVFAPGPTRCLFFRRSQTDKAPWYCAVRMTPTIIKEKNNELQLVRCHESLLFLLPLESASPRTVQ